MKSLPGNLTIKTEIYGENKYHLIDYHSLHLDEKSIKVRNLGDLYYNNYSIFFGKNCFETENKSLYLFSIDLKNNTYLIKTKTLSSDFLLLTNSNSPFLVLNKKKKDLYNLCENDIFKIGKLYIKVRKIKLINSEIRFKIKNKLGKNKSVIFGSPRNSLKIFNNSTNKINKICLNSSNQEKIFLKKNKSSKNKCKLKLKDYSINEKKNDIICRICYCSNSTVNNPLINVCKCKGSMEYIHYKCLKEWIDSKILKEGYNSEYRITYNENIFKCELCKEKYPEYIEYKNNIYNLIFYQPSFKEYCILETIRIDENRIKYYHIISLEEKKNICIGRNERCDLYFNELSLSNEHCYIRKENNNLYLEDNNSTFGTLVLIQNSIMELIPSNLFKIQINNIYFTFNYKLKNSLFSCFCAEEIGNTISYNKQNHMAIKKNYMINKKYDIYIY